MTHAIGFKEDTEGAERIASELSKAIPEYTFEVLDGKLPGSDITEKVVIINKK